MDELKWAGFLARSFKRGKNILAGIGDDCAVIKDKRGYLLISSDLFIENVHFKLKGMSFSDIGARAASRAISDIAACCGQPQYLVVSAGVPSYISSSAMKQIFRGIEKTALLCKTKVIGGDTARAECLFLDIWVYGRTRHPVLRRGAKAGDYIFLSGRLGRLPFDRPFLPRLKEAAFLSRIRPTAMIDISGGFLLDLFRLLKASRKGAVLWKDKLPLTRGRGDLRRGEDYELLFTCPACYKDRLQRKGFFCVGKILGKRGIFLEERGILKKLTAGGYLHF